jgi:hypothetical protein
VLSDDDKRFGLCIEEENTNKASCKLLRNMYSPHPRKFIMKKYNKNLRNDALHSRCTEEFVVVMCRGAVMEACEILS